MRDGDTIVALSSGALPSGVAVVRLSGPESGVIVRDILGDLPSPRRLTLSDIVLDHEAIDRGLVAWMPGPASFTGEDCAELQVHGSPAVVRALLRKLSSHKDIRLAEAGEFTRRAFENGKLDLTEVEGLGDLLEAETEQQGQQALARMRGDLSKQLDLWRFTLIDLRAEIEAQLDFSDESDVGELPSGFALELARLAAEFGAALGSVERGRIVREGLRVALAGPPNVGKSSLLNALAQSDVAIVSDEAGTTRDVREVPLNIGGRLVVLLDLAGLRDTDSRAEAEGVRRAREEIDDADLVLWLVAPDVIDPGVPVTGAPVWTVNTKADLRAPANSSLAISVGDPGSLAILTARLETFATDASGRGQDVLFSRERDRQALLAAQEAIELAAVRLTQPEVAAEALRRANAALERLLGRVDAEDILDRLFSSFCIGK